MYTPVKIQFLLVQNQVGFVIRPLICKKKLCYIYMCVYVTVNRSVRYIQIMI